MLDSDRLKEFYAEQAVLSEKLREQVWDLLQPFLDLPVEQVDFKPVTGTVGLTVEGCDPGDIQIDIDTKRSTVNIKMTLPASTAS
jgi:hypothetical protein